MKVHKIETLAKELKGEILSSWPMLSTEQIRVLTNQLKREILFKKRENNA